MFTDKSRTQKPSPFFVKTLNVIYSCIRRKNLPLNRLIKEIKSFRKLFRLLLVSWLEIKAPLHPAQAVCKYFLTWTDFQFYNQFSILWNSPYPRSSLCDIILNIKIEGGAIPCFLQIHLNHPITLVFSLLKETIKMLQATIQPLISWTNLPPNKMAI